MSIYIHPLVRDPMRYVRFMKKTVKFCERVFPEKVDKDYRGR